MIHKLWFIIYDSSNLIDHIQYPPSPLMVGLVWRTGMLVRTFWPGFPCSPCRTSKWRIQIVIHLKTIYCMIHGPCNLFRFSESKRIICGSHEQERTFSHPKFRTSHFDSAWAILFQSSINSSSRGGLSPFPDIGDLSSNSNYVTNKRFPLSSFL